MQTFSSYLVFVLFIIISAVVLLKQRFLFTVSSPPHSSESSLLAQISVSAAAIGWAWRALIGSQSVWHIFQLASQTRMTTLCACVCTKKCVWYNVCQCVLMYCRWLGYVCVHVHCASVLTYRQGWAVNVQKSVFRCVTPPIRCHVPCSSGGEFSSLKEIAQVIL